MAFRGWQAGTPASPARDLLSLHILCCGRGGAVASGLAYLVSSTVAVVATSGCLTVSVVSSPVSAVWWCPVTGTLSEVFTVEHLYSSRPVFQSGEAVSSRPGVDFSSGILCVHLDVLH